MKKILGLTKQNEEGAGGVEFLLIIALIVALFFGYQYFFGGDAKDATIKEQQEQVESGNIALHNVVRAKIIGDAFVIPLDSMGDIIPERYRNCVEVIYRWQDGSKQTLPRDNKYALMCPKEGKRIQSIAIGMDIWLPTAAGAMSDIKAAGSLHFIQPVVDGVGQEDGIVLDPDYLGDKYRPNAETGLDPAVVKACYYAESHPTNSSEKNIRCVAGWQPAANFLTIAPGWGMLGQQHYLVLANMGGLQIVPADASFVNYTPVQLGPIPSFDPKQLNGQ